MYNCRRGECIPDDRELGQLPFYKRPKTPDMLRKIHSITHSIEYGVSYQITLHPDAQTRWLYHFEGFNFYIRVV